MANWRHTLKIGDLHSAYKRKEISISELGRRVALRIKEASFFEEHWLVLDGIVNDLETVEDVEEYDDALAQLYDWGDQRLNDTWPYKKLCWVDSFDPPVGAKR